MNKMDNLINEIDKSDLVKDLRRVQEKVYEDNKLMELLKEFQNNPKDEIKEKILSSSLFQEYKIKETDLNLFIMDLNNRLKSIKGKGSCSFENN